MRWLNGADLTAPDILTSPPGPLQPDPDRPIASSFAVGQADWWRPPASGQVALGAAGRTALAVVHAGLTRISVTWLNSSGFPLSSRIASSPEPVELFVSTAGAPARIQLDVAGDGTVYRLIAGNMEDMGGAVDASSIPPLAGLNPDFANETLMSPRNVFLGRTGTRSGETASLELRRLRRTDGAFGLRRRLISGDAVITVPDSGSLTGGEYYCWADGLVPMPELETANRWRMSLPLRYWDGS